MVQIDVMHRPPTPQTRELGGWGAAKRETEADSTYAYTVAQHCGARRRFGSQWQLLKHPLTFHQPIIQPCWCLHLSQN